MATCDVSVRYEALLIAVREAIEVLDEGDYDAESKAQAILKDALEEIGEERRDDSWAV